MCDDQQALPRVPRRQRLQRRLCPRLQLLQALQGPLQPGGRGIWSNLGCTDVCMFCLLLMFLLGVQRRQVSAAGK